MKKIVKKKTNLIKKTKTIFPLYTASLLNLSNSTGNLTSKKNIGPLHKYFYEFKEEVKKNKLMLFDIEGWKKFYLENKKGKKLLKIAVEKNLKNIEKFKNALQKIDKKLTKKYIDDLVFKKTFIGMNIEYLATTIFAKEYKMNISQIKKANSKDESKGIDIWISNVPIQIKPYNSYLANDKNIIKKGVILYYGFDKKEDEIFIYFDEKRTNQLMQNFKNEIKS